MDTIRVLRLIEYIGPRDKVEAQVRKSIQGERQVNREILIRATTLGELPDILADKPFIAEGTKYPGDP